MKIVHNHVGIEVSLKKKKIVDCLLDIFTTFHIEIEQLDVRIGFLIWDLEKIITWNNRKV